MTILCIETSTSVCSVAICRDGKPIKQCICYEGSNHARMLPLYIEELLSYAREQVLCLDAIALSEGPGSYTGLRIGTSMAKGLCYGMNIPLIPVPTLGVLCQAALFRELLQDDKSALLIPMIDARRMEVYTTAVEVREEPLPITREQVHAIVVDSASALTSEYMRENPLSQDAVCYYFGDGAAKCQEVLTDSHWHFIPDVVPEAQYMGTIAESVQTKVSSIDLAYYEPYYLKEFVAAQSHVKGLKS